MSAVSTQPALYYHASGKRVPLTVDEDCLAIDTELAGQELPGALREKVRQASRPLTGKIGLIARTDLPPGALKKLEHSRAAFPVLQAAGVRLIPLPEVRVEESSEQALAGIRRWLREHADAVEVVRDDSGLMVLRPRSGLGRDALTLANELVEKTEASSATPRFLRITARP